MGFELWNIFYEQIALDKYSNSFECNCTIAINFHLQVQPCYHQVVKTHYKSMSVEPMIKQIIADPFACWNISDLKLLVIIGWI